MSDDWMEAEPCLACGEPTANSSGICHRYWNHAFDVSGVPVRDREQVPNGGVIR